MALTNILIGILTLLALSLPGIFKADRLADWQNGLIALAIVALFSFLTVLVGGRLTGNFATDWAAFAAAYSALLAGPARPLDDWLTSNFNLPFLKPGTQPISTQTVTTKATPASIPTPILMPPPPKGDDLAPPPPGA